MMNYYEILEVEIDSTTTEIKSAYRKLARKYHPDINNTPDAIEKFKMITLAYETLSNPQEREKYNILKGLFKKTDTTSKTSPKQAQQEYQNSTKKNSNYESDSDFTPLHKQNNKTAKKGNINLLKALKYIIAKFKKQKRASDNKKPKKGKNITTEITITPEEVVTGSKRVINVLNTAICPKCNGHRFINSGKCPHCDGKGEISQKRKITVTIPKGIKDGARLRLKGEGGLGKNGAMNGDLYIIVKIQALSKVQFEKQNIYYNLPITPFEAALGEEIKIPTFDGTIKLKLPKNTSSGQKFRLAGQGIKKNGKVGDLIITVSIEFSHDLSEDEIELYEKLKNLSKDDVRKNFINENQN